MDAVVVDGSGRDPCDVAVTVEDGRITELQAATTSCLCALAPGEQADLVLWNGNPLDAPAVFADPANAVLAVQTGRVVKDLR
ncbi:hypothetical protein [Lentzea jiangxiensis]|uniref:Amidohydrolase family protein n=1 Tax=Lentzea jiangxiensis TaxID=641025 RepID=A0A1H0JTS0_9PSEU|nr:hypothetical protein [Lentzea jiangxiensis]SDO46801.1 hypothetical protein SAMN05421507_102624 [Lentzea jiangxiensis]